MPTNNISLRIATIDDAETYFDWANDASVRQQSFSSQLIQWEDHKKWFQKKILDQNCLMYVLEDNSKPIGQIRFDILDGIARIDYSLGKDMRGKGLGKTLIDRGVYLASKSKNLTFQAEVKEQNIVSAKVFARCGFKEIDSNNSEAKIFQLHLDR